jgi:glutamate N-acetyltransferase/amino-acid N-acetyltransferase
MVSILANGAAENTEITEDSDDYAVFHCALEELMRHISKMLAKDGEGATRLFECDVLGAKNEEAAKKLAKSVICSSLTKAAIFGADANWGRVLCALGYAGAELNVNAVDVAFVSRAGRIDVCKDGAGLPFDEDIAKKILLEDEITVSVTLHDGEGKATAWGCDLTYDYVKINGDYRT